VRILLDECVPVGMGRKLLGHDVSTAPEMGWAGVKNGELLARAVEAGFVPSGTLWFDTFVSSIRAHPCNP
jgi:hypothetical protein